MQNTCEYTVKIQKTLQKEHQFVDSRSMLFDENGNVKTIYGIIMLENKLIGRCRLAETKYGFYESHAALEPLYCGYGLGSGLYLNVINYALSKGIDDIRSSTKPTLPAQRVWEGRTMNDQFMIEKSRTRYRILGRR